MIAMVATSCFQADVEDINLGEEGLVTFTINAPGISSRAINDGTGATQLTYAIYDAEWKYLSQTTIDEAFASNLTEVISLRLVKNKTYNFVFWAQNPNANCYELSLGTTVGDEVAPTVAVSYDGAISNDETRDAFFGQLKELKVDGTVNETVILTRPFAQINFATNHEDTRIAEAAGYKEVEDVVTSFTTRAYTSLNLADGGVANEVDVTFTATQNPGEDLVLLDESNSYDWLAMNYILVPAETSSLSTCSMTAQLTNQEDITIEYPMAPAKRNWRTNLVGNLLTEQAVITVKIDPVPEDEILVDYKDGRIVSSAQDLVAAVAAAPVGAEAKIKLEEDIVLTETLVIPADKIITINFNGHSVTIGEASGISTLSTRADAASTYAFNNHGILTLNGGIISARGIYNGYNAEGGENYTSAKIIVNGSTINALGEDGGACVYNYGVAEINGGTYISSGSYTLNTQAGSKMIVMDATLPNAGIYCLGTLEVGGTTSICNAFSGRHVIYAYDANVVINSGTFHNENKGNATIFIGGPEGRGTINGGEFTIAHGSDWTSYLIDNNNAGSFLTVNGGTFEGTLRSQGAAINGGTWEDVHANGFSVNSNVKVSGGTFVGTSAQKFAQQNQDIACTFTTNEDGSVSVSQAPYCTDENGNYHITSIEGWQWMDAQSDAFFSGKTVYLAKSLDFKGVTVNPVRFWNPENRIVFDGQNNTLSNVTISGGDNTALFNGTLDVKNLKVESATISGRGYTAVIGGNIYGNIENCHVANSVVTGSYWQVGGLAGQWNSGNIKDCSIKNTTVNGPSAVGLIVGIFNEAGGVRKIENCEIEGCAIAQTYSFGADYDTLFGMVAGYLNAYGEYHFNNISIVNSTLRGVASELLYGEVSAGKVFIDGVQQ